MHDILDDFSSGWVIASVGRVDGGSGPSRRVARSADDILQKEEHRGACLDKTIRLMVILSYDFQKSVLLKMMFLVGTIFPSPKK